MHSIRKQRRRRRRRFRRLKRRKVSEKVSEDKEVVDRSISASEGEGEVGIVRR